MIRRLPALVLVAALGLGWALLPAAVPSTALGAGPEGDGREPKSPEGTLELPFDARGAWSAARRLFDLHPPAWIERWLYNPRERTVRGLELLETAEPADATEAFETARRIAPDRPAVLFNAGTARLLAGEGRGAASLLERAVESPAATADGAAPERRHRLPAGLAQPAWYNLGAARLAADDPAGAVEAFEEALRLAPGDRDAKHNLEVALRRLEERRRLQALPPKERPEGDRPGRENESQETGGSSPEASGEDDRRAGRDPGGEDAPAGREPGAGPPADRRVLPRFQEQEDLSAAEAAALLESVETLERLQRHLQATRAARRAGSEEEDW
ncbi:MAG: tetratricopeptide repeat protein [Thermoanaerobaculia bacterium]